MGRIDTVGDGSNPAPQTMGTVNFSIGTLDRALYDHTLDGFERAELAMMALLAAERDTPLTFAVERDGDRPIALAFWQNRSPILKTATMSGAFFLHGQRDAGEICRASIAAFARGRFDLGWFRIPTVTAMRRIWLRTARNADQRRLLIIGMSRATRDVLPLADTYETFLKGLGKRTRRNIRHYRQRAEEIGIKFVLHEGFLPESSYDRIFELCARNGPKSFVPASVLAWRGRLSRQNGQFYSIVSTGSNELISLCRGFVWGRSAVIVYQLNSRDHYEMSPSLLHRSFLIEQLIQWGVREIIFTDGCEGLLKNACPENRGSSALVIPISPVAMFKAFLFISARYRAWNDYAGKLLRFGKNRASG